MMYWPCLCAVRNPHCLFVAKTQVHSVIITSGAGPTATVWPRCRGRSAVPTGRGSGGFTIVEVLVKGASSPT